jgi:hypothetical protein
MLHTLLSHPHRFARFAKLVLARNTWNFFFQWGSLQNQDFSKTLVVLGLQNSGRRSWYPFKAKPN